MKTTLELPEDLIRALKIRAVNEGRRLKDVVADVIAIGLDRAPAEHGATGERVRLPLVECAHGASPDEEMTPERVAAILVQEEAGPEGTS
jgi:plasmid stability protein